MIHIWIVIAWLVAIAWASKFIETAIGFPRVANLNLSQYDRVPLVSAKVVAIVPARNEASGIVGCLESLLGQDCKDLEIVTVDDRSTDATGALMDEVAGNSDGRLHVLHIAELPAGWLGKTHAMATAAQIAIDELQAKYLLFTDGDVFFTPDAVRRSLARAIEIDADHFVLMPTMLARTAGEAGVLSFLQAMSFWAMRPWRVSDPQAPRDAIGVGAFNLVRTTAYLEIGGFAATPMEVLEDLYLGRRIKWAGLRQDVAVGSGMVQLHWAAGARGIARGMTKNIFAVFRFRPAVLLVAAVWVALFSIGPVVFAALSRTRAAGCVALFSIIGVYCFASRANRIPARYSAYLPFAGALTVWAMLRSMFVTIREGGITWRGTFYDIETLRARMVRHPPRPGTSRPPR